MSAGSVRSGDPWTGGYYVSDDGDDENTGRTADDPWKTIAKVNEALAEGTIRRGDSVMFRRGDEFFGNIDSIPPSDGSGPRLTLSAYGAGPRPKISAYKVVDNPDSWQEHDAGVWKINLADAAQFSGNVTNGSANTGFIRVDGTIQGGKKWALADLSTQWDFYNDSEYLYVRSSGNPTAAADDFRVAVDGDIITGASALMVVGLDLVGTGGHGYRQADATNTEIADCRVHEIGGAQLTEGTRYGNGVELWMGSSDSLIHNNEISDVYDAACTMQGSQYGASIGISGCRIQFNKIVNCTQSFEYWTAGDDLGPGAGIVAGTFSDNICVNGGRSWGYAVREDKAGTGNFLMAYRQELPVDLVVTRNVFFDALNCYVYVSTNDAEFRDGFVSDHNTISLRPGTLVQAQKPYTIENAQLWVAETGQEVNSRWMVVPPSVATGADAVAYVTDNLHALRAW
ncbi:hypothetical protein [Rhodococcus wratislaviensis]|uniref:hypothetical protein n=1 Tax=Rhodococcus wratislaviensis TaxID=44752 RepID=UPI000F574E4B|nr:hypothetical protein [Rhodococcus wratislaviensis]